MFLMVMCVCICFSFEFWAPSVLLIIFLLDGCVCECVTFCILNVCTRNHSCWHSCVSKQINDWLWDLIYFCEILCLFHFFFYISVCIIFGRMWWLVVAKALLFIFRVNDSNKLTLSIKLQYATPYFSTWSGF